MEYATAIAAAGAICAVAFIAWAGIVIIAAAAGILFAAVTVIAQTAVLVGGVIILCGGVTAWWNISMDRAVDDRAVAAAERIVREARASDKPCDADMIYDFEGGTFTLCKTAAASAGIRG